MGRQGRRERERGGSASGRCEQESEWEWRDKRGLLQAPAIRMEVGERAGRFGGMIEVVALMAMRRGRGKLHQEKGHLLVDDWLSGWVGGEGEVTSMTKNKNGGTISE